MSPAPTLLPPSDPRPRISDMEGDSDEIFLANIDGSHARNITNAPGNDGHPWFSRDGKTIVFESDRTGPWKSGRSTWTLGAHAPSAPAPADRRVMPHRRAPSHGRARRGRFSRADRMRHAARASWQRRRAIGGGSARDLSRSRHHPPALQRCQQHRAQPAADEVLRRAAAVIANVTPRQEFCEQMVTRLALCEKQSENR